MGKLKHRGVTGLLQQVRVTARIGISTTPSPNIKTLSCIPELANLPSTYSRYPVAQTKKKKKLKNIEMGKQVKYTVEKFKILSDQQEAPPLVCRLPGGIGEPRKGRGWRWN